MFLCFLGVRIAANEFIHKIMDSIMPRCDFCFRWLSTVDQEIASSKHQTLKKSKTNLIEFIHDPFHFTSRYLFIRSFIDDNISCDCSSSVSKACFHRQCLSSLPFHRRHHHVASFPFCNNKKEENTSKMLACSVMTTH